MVGILGDEMYTILSDLPRTCSHAHDGGCLASYFPLGVGKQAGSPTGYLAATPPAQRKMMHGTSRWFDNSPGRLI